MRRKDILIGMLAIVIGGGCTTVKRYEAALESGMAWDEDYPIYVYPKDTDVPREYEVVGTMSIRDTPFTIFGGSLEKELDTLRRQARRVGADAIRLISVEEPDFLHAKYRIDAAVIRFTDEWSHVDDDEEALLNYLERNRDSLDPIEGVWVSSDYVRSRVGILRSASEEGREFVGFILENENPSWKEGDIKFEIRRGNVPGTYRGDYYLDDYESQRVAFRLEGLHASLFVLPLREPEMPLLFTRE